MQRILLINIDPPYRSLYSVLVAASLLKQSPHSQVTIITSIGNEALLETNLFQNIHLIDVEGFFNLSSKSSNETTEREMKRLLTPVINDEWDIVINLSANLLGAFFTGFLRYKEARGASFNSDLSIPSYNNLSAFLLTNVPDEQKQYLNFSYLLKQAAKFTSDSKLNSHINSAPVSEIRSKFAEIKKSAGKKKIVLIDTALRKSGKIQDFHFIAKLFKTFFSDELCLPILLGAENDDNSFLISRLREVCPGEIHMLNVSGRGLLPLFQNIDLLITDDLFAKSVADISDLASLLLWQKERLPLGDFSIHEKSLLVHTMDFSTEFADVVAMLSDVVIQGKALDLELAQSEFIYESKAGELPTLIPLGRYSEEFAHWWLGVRYLAKSEGISLKQESFDPKLYLDVIIKERDLIKTGLNRRLAEIKKQENASALWAIDTNEDEGLLGIATLVLKYKISQEGLTDFKKIMERLKDLLQEMLTFLSEEEKKLDVIVASSLPSKT